LSDASRESELRRHLKSKSRAIRDPGLTLTRAVLRSRLFERIDGLPVKTTRKAAGCGGGTGPGIRNSGESRTGSRIRGGAFKIGKGQLAVNDTLTIAA